MSLDSIINAWIYNHDPNGATRQIGLSAFLFLVAVLAAVALFVALPYIARILRVTPDSLRATKRRMALLASVALLMGFLAYIVRNPCRPDYYIGCGVNRYMYAGMALSAVVLVYAAAMIGTGKHLGWALAAYAVYYIHYEFGFTHKMGGFVQLAILTLAAALIVMWVCKVGVSGVSLWRRRART